MAIACSGQVTKSASRNSERPCRPNRYHSRHSKAASW
ncbi:hypothetical protein PHPALM_30587 [Phytophthora palmivora]|uniref:Uncharacterized protein n=1 Tax=Phytophthora palmivora TaxID=4796 RepID=A0A2P4X4S4_9STRA|nr:hypothetical protein PHPALM_30587 [Phytophthora palmivora]